MRPKRISILTKPDGTLEVLERPVKGARVFEEVPVKKLDLAAWIMELNVALEKDVGAMSKKHNCKGNHYATDSTCHDCGEDVSKPMRPKSKQPSDQLVNLIKETLESNEKLSKSKKLDCLIGHTGPIECAECGQSLELAEPRSLKPAARRPLAVGDRVSFEGYDNNGLFRAGSGTLLGISDTDADVEYWAEPYFSTSETRHVWRLGLRSFRRLVRKGRK